ncbi:MAG: hypothetical protein HQL12_04505 [Candidatus Omnitrophica bacterium]|nr:hypothetical protein [Candidatus Omnitrophota bacterium]
MKSMNSLDLMVRQISMTPVEYEKNKAIVSMYLDGELKSNQIPQYIKNVMFQWEAETIELELQAA